MVSGSGDAAHQSAKTARDHESVQTFVLKRGQPLGGSRLPQHPSRPGRCAQRDEASADAGGRGLPAGVQLDRGGPRLQSSNPTGSRRSAELSQSTNSHTVPAHRIKTPFRRSSLTSPPCRPALARQAPRSRFWRRNVPGRRPSPFRDGARRALALPVMIGPAAGRRAPHSG